MKSVLRYIHDEEIKNFTQKISNHIIKSIILYDISPILVNSYCYVTNHDHLYMI